MEVLLFEESSASYAASVRQRLPDGYVVLCTEAFDNVAIPTLFSYLVSLARKHSLLPTWQTTVLSHKEFFESLKVVCSRLNLATYGEFNVTTSDVITAHSAYFSGETDPNSVAYRDFLTECNTIDQFGLLQLLKRNRHVLEADLSRSFRIEGIVRNVWQSAAISFLSENKLLRRIQTELPVDGIVTEIISSQIGYERVDECHPKAVSCPKHSHSLEYTLTILKSFLNLLVNSRDEVAIACALACPFVNLSHEAFTVVKRAASEAKSPIYQFVLSYVMKKRLGGASYAAPAGCPVAAYVKELANFVDVMDRLQTLVEDNASTSVAIGKISTCILSKLSKAVVGNSLKISMVDKARDVVKVLLERIRRQNTPTDPAISDGIVGRDTIATLRTLADELATLGYHQSVSKLLCSPFSAATPSKTPVGAQTLFKLFKSPAELKNDDGDGDDDDDDGFAALGERVPLPAAPPPKVVHAFSVKYEAEPPKLQLLDGHHSTPTALGLDKTEEIDETASSSPKCLTARATNPETPVIKTVSKRKDAGRKQTGPKKRLKLVSSSDQENLSSGNSKKPSNAEAVKGKAKSRSKKPTDLSSNQRSIHSFFARM